MSTNVCSVFGCNNTYINIRAAKPPITFYCFPGRPHEQDRREAWIRFVKRKFLDDGLHWIPTKNSKICSSHFINNEKSNHPNNPNYLPTLHPLNQPRNLNPNFSTDKFVGKLSRFKRAQLRKTQPYVGSSKNPRRKPFVVDCSPSNDNSDPIPEPRFKDQACQTETLCRESSSQTEVRTETKSVGDDTRYVGFHGFQTVEGNEAVLKDLTSVSLAVFSMLLNTFPRMFPRTNEIGLADKLLLTLMKLKLGITFSALGSFFNVSGKTAQRIFAHTLNYLVQRTASFIVWPSRKQCQELMFDCFKNEYANCRVIIDCTEMYTETPSDVADQLHLYSQYKSGCTVKYLIGMTTGGLVSFVSEGFGGRTSDAQATIHSGMLDLLEPGDTVLAEKGFPSIETLFDDRKITLVMPPFAIPGEAQFSAESMNETCKIASARVHIERIIQRFKIYNLLNNTIPLDLLPYMDEAMRFIGVLVNLQPIIVKQKLG